MPRQLGLVNSHAAMSEIPIQGIADWGVPAGVQQGCKQVGIEGLVPHGPPLTTASLAISAGSGLSGATYAGARDSGDDLGSLTGISSMTTWPESLTRWVRHSRLLRYHCVTTARRSQTARWRT